MARSIDVSDSQNIQDGCSVTGVVSGVAVTHVTTQAQGVSVAANASATGTAIKCNVVPGTGMNPDVNAGVAVEAA
jgi:hypothetical protein